MVPFQGAVKEFASSFLLQLYTVALDPISWPHISTMIDIVIVLNPTLIFFKHCNS